MTLLLSRSDIAGLMRPSAGRINIGTYDLGKLSDAEVSRLRGTEVGVVTLHRTAAHRT